MRLMNYIWIYVDIDLYYVGYDEIQNIKYAPKADIGGQFS